MVSIGFTLIFGIMGVINFAHGSGYVLGGYFAYVTAGMLGLLMVLATRPRFLLLDEPAAGLERRERTTSTASSPTPARSSTAAC